MLRAIWFAIHFAIIFLGLIMAIHFDTWLGVTLMGVFIVKYLEDRISVLEKSLSALNKVVGELQEKEYERYDKERGINAK